MKFILIGAMALLGFGAFSQTQDEALLNVYSAEELDEFKSQNKYSMLVYALDNACYITDLPSGKSDGLESITIPAITEDIVFVDLDKRIEKQKGNY